MKPDLEAAKRLMDDPAWDAAVPNRTQPATRRQLPAHDDCSPIDPDAAVRHIEPGGTLGSRKGHETRRGQMDMLRAVAVAYNSREHLMIEAGTGVGKSLAYLIPSVLWSFANDTPVVVSTATRNLQSQLVSHDIPLAVKTLGDDASGFKYTVLKGRTNYLCLRSLGEYMMQSGWFALSEDEKTEFARVAEWFRKTEDGDLDTLGSDALRPVLACDGEDCYGKHCPYHQKCFVMKARQRAAGAHLIVANHALVLADALANGNGVLPAYGRIVFDEAHNLEDAATDAFSEEFSHAELVRLLGKLDKPARGFRGGTKRRGLLSALDRLLPAAPSARSAVLRARQLLMEAALKVRAALRAGDGLLAVCANLLAPAKDERILRFRTFEGRRQFALRGIFTDYGPDAWDEKSLGTAMSAFEGELSALQAILVRIKECLEQMAEADATLQPEDALSQIEAVSLSLTEFVLHTKFVLDASDPEYVYSAELRSERGKRTPHVCLVAAPLSIAKEMDAYFYSVKDSAILTSATLRVGDKFDYMAGRLGLSGEGGRVKAMVAASPFDYFRQTRVLAPNYLPDPAADGAGYADALSETLAALFGATRGRGLALFTSYDMMRATAEKCRPALEAAGLALIVQGEGLSREAMADELRKGVAGFPGGGTVLFGAQSFWEGVDIPGDALSCVVLARLPFPQVGEPIVAARAEKIEESGKKSFPCYMVPEAVIKFRQGFGRLVRSKSDRGVVVITDPRLTTKNYGAVFRKSLPATVHTVTDLADLVAQTAEFMASRP